MNRRLVVEADGGSRGNPGPAAYGAVVREAATGEVLVELADHLGHTTNNVAEYTGLLEGLRAAMEIDPEAHVEARLDSKLVVEQMSGRWAIKNENLRRIALEARDVMPRERVTFTWVPREKNKAADALANESMDAVERGRSGTIRRVVADAYETEVEADPVPPGPRPAIVGWGPDIGAPTVTCIVRHGVTQHSLERRFSGSGGPFDPPLVEQGLAQAEAAAAEVERRGGADVLLCSPMLRTRQTAAVIGRRIGAEAVAVAGLEEARFGEWDGLTFAEVMARWPDGDGGMAGVAAGGAARRRVAAAGLRPRRCRPRRRARPASRRPHRRGGPRRLHPCAHRAGAGIAAAVDEPHGARARVDHHPHVVRRRQRLDAFVRRVEPPRGPRLRLDPVARRLRHT